MCSCHFVKVYILNNEAINIIKKCDQNGIITSKSIDEQGFHRSVLQALVASGAYYQVCRGIYVRNDEWADEFFILQHKYHRGVFSHTTALYLHGYSDRVPMSFHMTFPKGYNSLSLKKENVTITRVTDSLYNLGLSETISPSGNKVVTYDIERCLCDVLRGKGDDIQITGSAMKKYILSKDCNINKLMHYAKLLRVEPKVRKYVEVLL